MNQPQKREGFVADEPVDEPEDIAATEQAASRAD